MAKYHWLKVRFPLILSLGAFHRSEHSLHALKAEVAEYFVRRWHWQVNAERGGHEAAQVLGKYSLSLNGEEK